MSWASATLVNVHRSSGRRVEVVRAPEALGALQRISDHGGVGRVDRETTYPTHIGVEGTWPDGVYRDVWGVWWNKRRKREDTVLLGTSGLKQVAQVNRVARRAVFTSYPRWQLPGSRTRC